MIFRHFLMDCNESNSFIIACEDTREGLLVDAGSWSVHIEEFLSEHDIRLSKVFITHDHYDHTNGLPKVLSLYDVEVFSRRGKAGGDKRSKIEYGDTIDVGKLTGTVLDTSGHTADSISLVFPGMIFSGDALFAGSIGGTGSPKAATREVDLIRQNIFSLPGDYEVHTGHGPSTTVAIESKYNPFFVM